MVVAALNAVSNPPFSTSMEMPAVFTMSGPMGGSDPTEDSPPPAAGPAPPLFAIPGTTTPATPSSPPTAPTAFSGARLAAPTPPPPLCRDRELLSHVTTYPTIPASARNPTIESTALRMDGLLVAVRTVERSSGWTGATVQAFPFSRADGRGRPGGPPGRPPPRSAGRRRPAPTPPRPPAREGPRSHGTSPRGTRFPDR